MQGLTNASQLTNAPDSPLERREPHPIARPPGAAAPNLVYDLRLQDGRSDVFYAGVARFSNEVLAEIDLRAGTALHGYSQYVQDHLKEAPRSLGEYSIEYLTLGLALSKYAGAAESTPNWVIDLARELFWLRSRELWLRSAVDLVRALLTHFFLVPRLGRKPSTGRSSLERLPRLIEWLHGMGDFEQEAMRLNNWRSFLDSLPHATASHWCETAKSLFNWFQQAANQSLGIYTRGVSAFLTGEFAGRLCREDQLFCSRQPAEYHLNMVAAEVMNRGLRDDFARTPHRVVLVPTCMRGARAATCMAHESGMDLTCTACDPACGVNRLTHVMHTMGARVYLVPHSTGFSQWLARWQSMPEVGVVAAACMLNILPGGFEMRARGIASQCVPLDFPGCRKHWAREDISTSLNVERIVQIVQIV